MQKHIVVSSPQSAVNVKTLVTPRGLTSGWSNPTRSRWSRSNSPCAAARAGSGRQGGHGMLLASLLDEGAGDLDAQAFQRALDERAIEISFHADRDAMTGRMRTLVKNLDRAAELLRLAVNEPRFDEEPFIRVREHANARLAARRQRSGFGRGEGLEGERLSGPSLRPADRRLARIAGADRAGRSRGGGEAASGARSARHRHRRGDRRKGAADLVDKAFADLPARADLEPVAGGLRGLGRSTRSRSTCRSRPSVSAARASCATIPTISRASSPPMCSAAPAT